MIDDTDPITIYCYCDKCKVCAGILGHKDRGELRDYLIKTGWSLSDSGDLCPDCKDPADA